jgi:hypothetical protein
MSHSLPNVILTIVTLHYNGGMDNTCERDMRYSHKILFDETQRNHVGEREVHRRITDLLKLN